MAGTLSPAKFSHIFEEIQQTKIDPIQVLKNHRLLTESERKRITGADDLALEKAINAGAKVIEQKDYPESLQVVDHTPPALFYRGSLDCLNAPCVAIVGTRRATTYGLAVAQKFSERLAKVGLTIISGGASGIDTAAHRGALDVGGKTAAVMGTGIDKVFPATNHRLFDEIAQKNGVLVSQFACGATTEPAFFIQRNELIAALADAVLVIEAPEKSGALRTAGVAANLNRPVFVVPGSISLENYRGSHALIRDGATLVDHPDQVFEAFEIVPDAEEDPETAELSDVQRQILEVVSDQPMAAEKIIAMTGLETSEVLGELTMMEIDGWLIRDGIGYSRKP
ncbi:MAG: DNA-processing protein DprA [Armatimonadetes bacterium]|nr:DNA-processing protein DprA [Armatimonadota bacterium]